MENVSVVAAIIAVISAVKSQVPQVNGLITVILAVVLGGVAGYLGLDGINIQQGVVLGLSAVGAVTVAQKVSN